MSGSQPPAATPSAAAAADPSMEDILASIRRILSEDEPAPASPTPPPAEPEPPEEDDVLVLDASMEVAEASPVSDDDDFNPPPLESPAAAEPEGESELTAPTAFEAPAPTPIEPPSPLMAEPEPIAPMTFVPDLMAPETTAAAASSVSGLMRTLASERQTRVYGGGPTIEDLVREELRPLLKHWLDANLPDLVERLVRAEIERVVRRAVP